MRKANVSASRLIEQRLAETHLSEHDRNRVLTLVRDAEAVAEAIMWARDKIASIGALFLKPGFKN